MIRIETIVINNKEYTRTRSDAGLMIERSGALYEEAIDPVGSGRTYTETSLPIVEDPDETTGITAQYRLTQY